MRRSSAARDSVPSRKRSNKVAQYTDRMRFVVAVLVLIAAAAPAHACKRGSLLFRTITAPVPGLDVGDKTVTVIEARSAGAWSKTVDGAVTRGCLAAHRLKLLRTAVKRARLRTVKVDATCRALNTHLITYQRGKKKVTVGVVCSSPVVDEDTYVAGRCLAAVVDASLADADVAAACVPDSDE